MGARESAGGAFGVLQRKRTAARATERVAAEMGSTARVLQAVVVVEEMDGDGDGQTSKLDC